MSKFLNWLGGGAAKLVENIGIAVDRNTTTDAERLQLRNELNQLLQTFILEAQKQEIENITNARDREVNLKDSLGGYMMNIAAGVFVLLFVLQILLPWFSLTEPQTPGYQTAIKTLEYILIAIVSYWFGSSNGSKLKDRLMGDKNIQ